MEDFIDQQARSGQEKKEPNYFGLIILGIIGFVAFLAFWSSATIVSAGERGVIMRMGAVQDRILGEGFHFVTPFIEKVETVNVKTQTVSFDNKTGQGDKTEASSMFCTTKDLQDVQIAVVVNYHQDATKVNKIYQQYGSTYQVNILEPIIREVVKSQSSLYTADELVTKRAEFSEKVSGILSEKFAEKDSIFERLNIVNFQFSDSFNKAIESKVTAEQDALAAKNKLEQVKFEAEQRIAQAQGEAEAIRIQAQAVTQQGGADYVRLQAIKAWDGKLPNYMLSGGVPFLNIQ